MGFAEASRCIFFVCRALGESCLFRCVSVCMLDLPACVSGRACELMSEFEQGGAAE